MLHLRLGDRPEAQIWINHPGERILSGYGRPSYWGGCGTLPRVHQYRDLAIVDFELKPEQLDFTHAWLPEAEMDEVQHAGERVFVRAGAALGVLIGSASIRKDRRGADRRLRDPASRPALPLDRAPRPMSAARGACETFARRFAGLAVADGPDGEIWLDDPDYGRVVCRLDGKILAEGGMVDPAAWTIAGHARLLPGGDTVPLPSLQRQMRQKKN